MPPKKPRNARNNNKPTKIITSGSEVVQIYRKKDTTGSALGDSQVMSEGNDSIVMGS